MYNCGRGITITMLEVMKYPYRFWLYGISMMLVGLVGIVGNTAQIFLFAKKVTIRVGQYLSL